MISLPPGQQELSNTTKIILNLSLILVLVVTNCNAYVRLGILKLCCEASFIRVIFTTTVGMRRERVILNVKIFLAMALYNFVCRDYSPP